MTEKLNPLMLDTTTLTSGVGKLDTEITVEKIKDIGGVEITDMSVFGEAGVLVIDALTSKAEIIKFKEMEVLSNGKIKLKQVERGMKPVGDLISDPSTYAKAHGVGAEVILSNAPQFFNNFMQLGGDQTLEGNLTIDGEVIYNGATGSPRDIITREAMEAYTAGITAGANTSLTTYTAKAGEDILDGKLVSWNPADGRWYNADKDDTDIVTIGYMKTGYLSGEDIVDGVVIKGKTETSGLSIGKKYLGTNGSISDTGIYFIGDVSEAGVLYLHSDIVDQNLIDAQKGTGGLPSDTNRYITQEGLSVNPLINTTVFELDASDTEQIAVNDTKQSISGSTKYSSRTNSDIWEYWIKVNQPTDYPARRFQILGKGTVKIKFETYSSARGNVGFIYSNDEMVFKEDSGQGSWVAREYTLTLTNFVTDILVGVGTNSNGDSTLSIRNVSVNYDVSDSEYSFNQVTN